jgi:hypothetical protein
MKALKGGFALNGCDAFMFAMDYAMVKRPWRWLSRSIGYNQNVPALTCGNICHLLLTFSSGTNIKTIAHTIIRSRIFQIVSSLRLSTRIVRGPIWFQAHSDLPTSPSNEIDGSPELEKHFETPQQLQDWILNHSIDPRVSAPFGFLVLPTYSAGPSLLFFWHHALTDARGGELLVQQLGRSFEGMEEEGSELSFPHTTWARGLKDSLRIAHRTKNAIFSKSAPDILRIPGVVSRNNTPLPTYRFLQFSEDETKNIDLLAQEVCSGIFPMAMYLAVTKRAATPLFSASTEECGKIFIPVPHDMRRFTKEKSPLSNQLSFLFFSLEKSSQVSLKDETAHIIDHLHDSIFSELHWGMLAFLRYLRFLPPPLLWRTIERPTKGHPASFYFSDIGSTLSQISEFSGVNVINASHFPPVLVPPGLTTVWSRFRETLRVTICFDQNVLSNESIDTFVHRLRKELNTSP